MKRFLALVSSLLPIALTAAILVAPSTDSISVDSTADDASSFTATASRIRGHGELAAISPARELYLLGDGVQGTRKVSLTGEATRPMWSHDGRWLAVTTQPAPSEEAPLADRPTKVWLVSRAGDVVRELTPEGQDVYHAAAAWSPRANRLAIAYTAGVGSEAGPTQRLDVVGTSGNVTSIVSTAKLSGFAWSPNGRRIAVGVNQFDQTAAKWDSRLVTFRGTGGGGHTVETELGDILDVAGWWPDGSRVLAWVNRHGGTTTADGAPLVAVSVQTGHRRQLAKRMLPYPAWLATSKVRNKVALITGGNRILTAGHKHLKVCSRTHCRNVPQPDRKVTFDPAWGLDGQLAAVRDRALAPIDGDFSLGGFTQRVEQSGGVYLLRHGRLRAVAGGEQATAPVFGPKGSLVFVRGSSLYRLPPETTTAHRIAGPIDASNSFYGFVSWSESFAWSDAVPDVGRQGSPQLI